MIETRKNSCVSIRNEAGGRKKGLNSNFKMKKIILFEDNY